MTHHNAGKGSKQRPGKGYADGWERIWGKKKRAKKESNSPAEGRRMK